MVYLVDFSGPFGFLKPWTAVRDGRTNSQTFLTPSTIEGMRQKLGVSAILRYRLSYAGVDWQQEMTHARGWTPAGTRPLRRGSRPRAVVQRGVLLQPRLVLAFPTAADAELACHQHLCLSRNEDVLLPSGKITPCTAAEFEAVPGAELLSAEAGEPSAVLVGHNHYQNNTPMYGRLTFTQPAEALSFFSTDTDVH